MGTTPFTELGPKNPLFAKKQTNICRLSGWRFFVKICIKSIYHLRFFCGWQQNWLTKLAKEVMFLRRAAQRIHTALIIALIIASPPLGQKYRENPWLFILLNNPWKKSIYARYGANGGHTHGVMYRICWQRRQTHNTAENSAMEYGLYRTTDHFWRNKNIEHCTSLGVGNTRFRIDTRQHKLETRQL